MTQDKNFRLEILKQAVSATKEPNDILPLANRFLEWVEDTENKFEYELEKWIQENPEKSDELVNKITQVKQERKGYEVFMNEDHWKWKIGKIRNPLTGLY